MKGGAFVSVLAVILVLMVSAVLAVLAGLAVISVLMVSVVLAGLAVPVPLCFTAAGDKGLELWSLMYQGMRGSVPEL
ncbi:hypothetical protein CEF21_04250 [Bacillus sp. FJAT-42376]|uniref:hypothetical protein n=1 Tax=Bacillus sp. FJAT-42376 TaxID=2014076 RepID=UPI000F4E2BC5|nr:hypothetical protein [Bacillus sp. FJAT-42376]AZB41573.1 hypothetical protein CEF21_04250 [Bacillus sp. FJAT-42376]